MCGQQFRLLQNSSSYLFTSFVQQVEDAVIIGRNTGSNPVRSTIQKVPHTYPPNDFGVKCKSRSKSRGQYRSVIGIQIGLDQMGLKHLSLESIVNSKVVWVVSRMTLKFADNGSKDCNGVVALYLLPQKLYPYSKTLYKKLYFCSNNRYTCYIELRNYIMNMCQERTYIINCIEQGLSNEEIKTGRINDALINHYRITLFSK